MAATSSVLTTENNQFHCYYEVNETNVMIHFRSYDLAPTIESQIFLIANNVVLGTLVAFFGIFSNIINMIVFHKQGFTTTANISIFSLALSDLFCLVTYEGFNIFVNPLMDRGPVPFVSTEFQYLIVAWFYVCFGRITSWITAYISAERCLSVALPLKVKQIVSPRKTTALMCAIFAINLLTLVPEYSVVYLDWSFVPERNKTLIVRHHRSFKNETEGLTYILTSISGMLSFVAVIMMTTVLIIKLNQTSNWHIRLSTNDAHSEARSLRDKKTMKLVVMIASILIICYIPGVILCLVSVFKHDFNPSSKYNSIYFCIWSSAVLVSAINSSVNMLLYYNMSTKYRETFNELFFNCVNSIDNSD